LLQDWDLVQFADGGYSFRVELVRRWILEHKPLDRVQEELDHIEPVAESFYQAAWGLYQGGQLDQAVGPLHQAIAHKPYHEAAILLLADIFREQGRLGEARELLAHLYEYRRTAAIPRLKQVLLAQAEAATSNEDQLSLYEEVLDLDPNQPEAIAGRQRIWQQRGDTALKDDKLDTALEFYRLAGLVDSIDKVEQEIRSRNLDAQLQQMKALERESRYRDALVVVHEVAAEYPEVRDWTSDLERLEHKASLADPYQRGLRALQGGDRQTAQTLLSQVVALDPRYEDATRYLHLAVTGVDVVKLQIRSLSLRNPLDHMRLLWWVLAAPRKLNAHREVLGKGHERTVGEWLVSTLIWLPLFIPALALGLGRLPRVEMTHLPAVHLWLPAAVVLVWSLTGWLCRLNSGDVVAMAVAAAFVVTVFVVSSVAGDAVLFIMILVTVWVAGALAVDIGGRVTFGAVGGVASGVAARIAGDAVSAIVGRVTGAVAGAVMALALVASVVVLAVGLARHVEKSLEAVRPSWLGRGALGVLVLAYGFLIWFSFLDGWQML
jgi:tetratricopeptide (TPR) repeat protein